jgi:hypothetical protein
MNSYTRTIELQLVSLQLASNLRDGILDNNFLTIYVVYYDDHLLTVRFFLFLNVALQVIAVDISLMSNARLNQVTAI